MWRKGLITCYCNNERNALVVDEEETGLDRLKRMYSRDKCGMISPQLHCLIQNASSGTILSAAVGGFVAIVKAKNDYLRKNVASTYESQYLAKRNLTDTMTLSGVRGGLKFALKYGSFSSLYLLSIMTVATYNNKMTVYDHIGTGAFLGAVYRFNFGLKGMAAAASLGGVLGALAGGIVVSLMKLKKIDFQEFLAEQDASYHEFRKKRPVHNI